MDDKMLTCFDVANYFWAQQSEEAGDLISNLKLQKLVYYAQGCWLGLFDAPLFQEPLKAWVHGPVVPELYHAYKQYGSGPLPLPVGMNFSIFSTETREVLDDVYSVYGQFSAWKLREMTHAETPWKEAAPSQGTITQEAMRAFFKFLVRRD